jgi:chromosome segregation ATPase
MSKSPLKEMPWERSVSSSISSFQSKSKGQVGASGKQHFLAKRERSTTHREQYFEQQCVVLTQQLQRSRAQQSVVAQKASELAAVMQRLCLRYSELELTAKAKEEENEILRQKLSEYERNINQKEDILPSNANPSLHSTSPTQIQSYQQRIADLEALLSSIAQLADRKVSVCKFSTAMQHLAPEMTASNANSVSTTEAPSNDCTHEIRLLTEQSHPIKLTEYSHIQTVEPLVPVTHLSFPSINPATFKLVATTHQATSATESVLPIPPDSETQDPILTY